MAELGAAFLNPMGGAVIWTDGTHPGDPMGDCRVTASELNAFATHLTYMQTNSVKTQQFVTGGAAAGQLAYIKYGPDGDGLYHDGTVADLSAMLNFTILVSEVYTAGSVTPRAVTDNGGGLGNGSTVKILKNGADISGTTLIRDLLTGYDLGVTDLPTLETTTWGIQVVAFAGGATYVRAYSLPVFVIFSYDLAPPTSVGVTGQGGLAMGRTSSGASFGSGAGPAPELHLNQWGLEAFTLDTDLEEHL